MGSIQCRGDLKSDPSKSGNIKTPDFSKIRFQKVQFWKDQAVAIGYGLKNFEN